MSLEFSYSFFGHFLPITLKKLKIASAPIVTLVEEKKTTDFS